MSAAASSSPPPLPQPSAASLPHAAAPSPSSSAPLSAKIDALEARIDALEGEIEAAKKEADREMVKLLLAKQTSLQNLLLEAQQQQQQRGVASGAASSSSSSALADLRSAVRCLRDGLAALAPLSEAALSDPAVVSAVPFLWPDLGGAPQRLALSPGQAEGVRTLSFMGRKKMAELLATIRSLSNLGLERLRARATAACKLVPSGLDGPVAAAAVSAQPAVPSAVAAADPGVGQAHYAKLLVYGTPGWGKSYMMAAAAAVLRGDFLSGRSKLRVVYLPDCGQLREEPVAYMQKALLVAFAADEACVQQIVACRTADELVTFVRNVLYSDSFLLFLADQTNKLTGKLGPVVNSAKEAKKAAALELLHRSAYDHFLVEAISINDSNKEDVAQKQENRLEMPVFGEMALEEWSAWLQRHRANLPLMDDGFTAEQQDAKIAAETGRNLLFLSPFIRPAAFPASAAWTFAAAWRAFLNLKEVRKIYQNLKDFAGRLETETGYPKRNDALHFMAKAVCEAGVLDEPSHYDARYFYVLDGIAHTVGQYVSRCAAAVIESHRRLDLFRENLWIHPIRLHRGNRSVQGFLAEKAVLGFLALGEVAARVLGRPELSRHRVEVRSFTHGTEASSLSSSHVVTLYIPEEFNYKAVDAVLRIVERRQEAPVAQAPRKSKRRPADKKRASQHSQSKKARSDTASAGTAASSPAAAAAASRIAAEQSDSGGETRDEDTDPEPSVTVTLAPVQVTMVDSVSDEKRARSFRFFERRAAWLSDLQDDPRVRTKLHFLFVVRQCAVLADQAAVPLGRDANNSFSLSYVPLARVNQRLDRAVDSPAAASSSAMPPSPPKINLAPAAAAT